MRILLVVHRFPPEPVGGYDRWAMCLSRHLAGRGHEVAVVARRPGEDVPAEQDLDGVRVLRYTPRRVPGWLWMFGRSLSTSGVKGVLRECDGRYDACISHPFFVKFVASCAPSMRRVYRAGGTLRGSRQWEEFARPAGSWKLRLLAGLSWRQMLRRERQAIRRAHRTVSPSESVRRQLHHYYGVPLDAVQVIPHGVDPEQFLPAPRPPDGTLRVLSVGRLDSVKNHVLLLEAVARAAGRRRMRVRVVGDGAMRDRLARRAEELGLAGQVELAGHSDDVLPHYQWADAFAFPSVYEAFGIALLEAMSCELPCVGLRCRPPEVWVANDEIVADGQTGLLVDDAEAFAAALDRLAEDDELRRGMGQAGRRRVLEQFTWSRVAEMYERLLCGLVEGGPR